MRFNPPKWIMGSLTDNKDYKCHCKISFNPPKRIMGSLTSTAGLDGGKNVLFQSPEEEYGVSDNTSLVTW